MLKKIKLAAFKICEDVFFIADFLLECVGFMTK